MNSNRNIGLDYLRSIAIVIVIFNHGLLGFYIDTSQIKFEGLVAAISASTVIAIEWLFVLSGFLIGAMMIRSFEKQNNWWSCARDFWLRRWFRTFPNYYLFVLINFILVSLGVAKGAFEFKYLVFSQNLAWIEATPHFFGESWSLALDEWFYLIMPIMIGILGLAISLKRESFLWVAGLLILLPTLARLVHTAPVEFFQWDAEIRRITIYHLDATGWGVLAASVNRWFPAWWKANRVSKAISGFLLMALGLFFVIGLLQPTWMSPFLYKVGNAFSITLMAGGTFLMLPWLTSWKSQKHVTSWIVEKLSLYSYSIYLVHFPLIFIFRYFIHIDGNTSTLILACIVAFWLVSIFSLSALLFHWFEKPVADLRESFTKRVDASPF
jgi:peptidoglycan/LPS O-acetylase OafA/YrhL